MVQSRIYSKAHDLHRPMKTLDKSRISRPEVFLGKGVLKLCSKFTGEHPCRSATSIKLQSKVTLLKSHFGVGVFL